MSPRRPMLQVIIDLTTLGKTGKFKPFEHLISVYNGKRGLHLVVLYLVVGRWRVPWSFRVWRGKGTDSSAFLGTKTGFMLAQIINQTLSGDDFGALPHLVVWSFCMGYASSNIMRLQVCVTTACLPMGDA
jgi:hypothetical protein